MNSGTGFSFGSSNTGNNPWGSNNNNNQSGGFGFGANNNQSSGFGGGFGQNNNTNTGGMFGQSNNTGGFGQSSNTGGFGGGFGANNNNQSSGFGGGFGQNTNNTGGAFGQTNTNNAFGMNNNQSSGFGQSNNTGGFGQSNTTGGFGQSSNTGGFGFGANNNNNAFGSSNTGGFGQSNAGGFGQSNTNTGGFGGFGGSNTGSMFGGGANNAGGTVELGTGHTAFKVTNEKDPNNNPIVHQSITLMPVYKGFNFEELRWQDYQRGRRLPDAPGPIPMQYPEPTGMFAGAAQNHAFNNVLPPGTTAAPVNNNTSTGFGFGNNSNTSTGFGNTGGFGSNTNTGFGSNTNTNTNTGFGNAGGFGQTNTTGNTGFGFGQNNQTQSTGFGNTTGGFGQTNNAFGQNNQNKPGGLFGSNTGTTSTGFGFGNTNTATNTSQAGGLFGNNNQQSTGTGLGGFGNTNTGTSGFGTSASTGFGNNTSTASTGFGFGQTNTSTAGATTGFGSNTTGGGFGFGNTNTSTAGTTGTGFGTGLNTNTTGTSLFGNTGTNTAAGTGTTGFGFGTNNTAATGTTGTGLFGNNAAKPSFGTGFGNTATSTATGTSLFGNNAATGTAGTSLFGGAAAKPATSFSFGGNTGTSGSLFGGNTTTSTFGTTPQTNTFGTSTFGTTPAAGTSLFGGSTLGGVAANNAAPIVAQVDKDIYGTNLATPESVATIFNSKITPAEKKNIPLATPVDSKPVTKDYQASSASSRFLPYRRPLSTVNLPSSFIQLTQTPVPHGKRSSIAPVSKVYGKGIMPSYTDLRPANRPYFATRFSLKKNLIEASGIFNDSRSFFSASSSADLSNSTSAQPPTITVNGEVQPKSSQPSTEAKTIGSTVNGVANPPANTNVITTSAATSTPVSSNESKYYTVPEMKELHKMSEEELSSLKNFKAGHRDFGEVEFLQEVDLSQLSLSALLGDIITFKRHTCTVYPDKTNKPALGKGLNVPSKVTLFNCFPEDVDSELPEGQFKEETVLKYVKTLQLLPDTEFIDYDKISGKWTFKVAHFSTYKAPSKFEKGGLVEDKDDDNQEANVNFTRDHSPPFLGSNMPTPKRQNTGSPLNSSNKDHLYFASIELGLRKSFRIGWGPNNSIVFTTGFHINPGNSPQKSHLVRVVNNAFSVDHKSEFSFPLSSLEESLQLTLNTSIPEIENEVPIVRPSSYMGFDTYLHALGEGELQGCLELERSVWSLSGQLWGSKLDDPGNDTNSDGESENDESVNYPMVYKRKKLLKKLETKEKVSNWWTNLVSPIIQKSLKSQEIKNSQDPIDLIWLHLTGHNLEEASDLAFTTHNPRLASLLIQAGGEGEFREYINLQIKSWHTEHCLEFIDSKKRKIYELLQGNMNPYQLATGHFDEVCKGLDWRRSFGLFIWYIGLYENDLAKCLHYYDRCMQKWIENKEEDGVTTVGMKNSLPFPWYDTLQSFLWKNREHYDILYHMLHLGVNSKYSLEKLLHPLGITSNSLDFRLSWQLALILTKQIGIGKFESETNPNYCMDRLTVLFINQLLGLKLWRWAIFASCHLSNAKCRSQMIRHILARNIEPNVDIEFQQILQGVDIQTTNTTDVTVSLKDLRVPSIWIEDSFANLYAYQGRFRDELLLLLKVKKFDKAYYVFLTKLGPNMLMNRAFEEIVGILSKFPSEKVKRWDYGGKYYLKLSQLMLQYNQIQANATEEDDIQIVVDLETSLQVLITDLNSLEKNQGFTSNTRPEIDSKLRARMVDQIVDSLTYLRKLLGSCSFKDLGNQPINLSRSRKIDQSLELGRVFFNDN